MRPKDRVNKAESGFFMRIFFKKLVFKTKLPPVQIIHTHPKDYFLSGIFYSIHKKKYVS